MPDMFEIACKENKSEDVYKMLSGTRPGNNLINNLRKKFILFL